MAVVVKENVSSGSWAASYLQCFSRCSRKCRRESPGRRRDGRKDGMPGRAGVDSDMEQDRDEQLIIVKVSYLLIAIQAGYGRRLPPYGGRRGGGVSVPPFFAIGVPHTSVFKSY